MVKFTKAEKKVAYDVKLCQLLDDYSQVLIVAADNVGSNQLQNIRKGLRGDSIVLMGKNVDSGNSEDCRLKIGRRFLRKKNLRK